jgi:biopolymer transport protein ExbB
MAWLDGWTYRKKLTVASTEIDSTLSNFPVLISLSTLNFDFDKALSNGNDIRFTSSDGEIELKFEREKHSSVDEEAYYWVKVPSVSDSVDTEFYMYYGNDEASDGEDAESVWDSNYKCVLHATTDNNFNDSTNNNNDGTALGDAELNSANKKVGEQCIKLDGSGDVIRIDNTSDFAFGTGDFSIRCWVKFNAMAGGPYNILAYSTASGSVQFFLEAGQFKIWGMSSIVLETSGFSGSTGNWYLVEFSRSGNNWEIKVGNTVYASTSDSRSLGTPNHTRQIAIGAEVTSPGYSQFLNGYIDEYRISKGVKRTSAWMKAVLASEEDTLLTYGSEEEEGTSAVVGDINPALQWQALIRQQLNPSLQWDTKAVAQKEPKLQWKTSLGVKHLPNIVNYPFYFSNPTTQTSEVPLLISGCPVGFSMYLGDTGSSGQTTIKVYAGEVLKATKTIGATDSNSYIDYFDLDTIVHPADTFSVEITEVATGASDLKVNLYLITFPYRLEEMYYENIFGARTIHGEESKYLFLSADYWTIDFNQPLGEVVSIKTVKNDVETTATYSVENGVYYNNQLRITPPSALPDSIRVVVKDLKNDKHIFDLEPNFEENTVDVPEYITATEEAVSYGTDLATGGTASADSEEAGFEAGKAFDDNDTTYWKSTSTVSNLAYALTSAKQIKKIAIKAVLDGGDSTVKRWVISGSNEASPDISDEDDWTYIAGGILENNGVLQEFTFLNENTYIHYRITVLDNYSETGFAGIYEVSMYEKSVTMNGQHQFYSYVPLLYYQYSFDGGSTWSDLDTFDSNYLDVDLTDQASGTVSILLRLFQTQDSFQDSFTVEYTGDPLDCYAEFDGDSFEFYYSDIVPFANLILYVDDEIYSQISPTMADGFDDPTFPDTESLTVADGTFYYNGAVYSHSGQTYDLAALGLDDEGNGDMIIVFGFNTKDLIFEVKFHAEGESLADFYPIVEGTLNVADSTFYKVVDQAEYIFTPEEFELDLETDSELRLVFEDVTGRTKTFEYNYVKTFYNVWRTLTVTDGDGNEVLPGQIHQETELTYTVDTEE